MNLSQHYAAVAAASLTSNNLRMAMLGVARGSPEVFPDIIPNAMAGQLGQHKVGSNSATQLL